MSYVYIQSEPALWTVGFYGPNGKWNPESDHPEREKAARRVHYLNGGNPAWDNLIFALFEARRVCKRELEITEQPNFADEHEWGLEVIEKALKAAGKL